MANGKRENISIKLSNGKYFYITPGGAKLTSGGKVKPVAEVIPLVTNKGDLRRIRKTLHRLGRRQECLSTL
jgi:hypothetical protein